MYPISRPDSGSETIVYYQCPANNYLVNFEDYQGGTLLGEGPLPSSFRDMFWKNPHASLVKRSIQSYIPCDSGLKSLFEKELQCVAFSKAERWFLNDNKDTLNIISFFLEPKNLVNFSEVCKCCYLATKSSAIWQIQLNKLFPNVKFLSSDTCSFAPEQQFQVIFDKFCKRQKPFVAQMKYYYGRVKELTTDLEENGHKYSDNIAWLRHELKVYCGKTYPEYTDPTSKIGLCLNALKLIHSEEFDKQGLFENAIRASEVAKNNLSSVEIQIEEVDEDYEDSDTRGGWIVSISPP